MTKNNISPKQQEEIDFLMTHFSPKGEDITEEEKSEYITSTVYGKTKITKGGMGGKKQNRIFDAKRRLDIMIKMWRIDLVNGLLGIEELYTDFGSTPYGKKLVDSILKGLDFSKRKQGEGFAAITMHNSIIRQEKFGLKYNQ